MHLMIVETSIAASTRKFTGVPNDSQSACHSAFDVVGMALFPAAAGRQSSPFDRLIPPTGEIRPVYTETIKQISDAIRSNIRMPISGISPSSIHHLERRTYS